MYRCIQIHVFFQFLGVIRIGLLPCSTDCQKMDLTPRSMWSETGSMWRNPTGIFPVYENYHTRVYMQRSQHDEQSIHMSLWIAEAIESLSYLDRVKHVSPALPSRQCLENVRGGYGWKFGFWRVLDGYLSTLLRCFGHLQRTDSVRFCPQYFPKRDLIC